MSLQTALLGCLTIPGRPEHLRTARGFVARSLDADFAETDTAVLLVSELISNSLQHTDSGRPGGMVTVTLIANPAGLRVEVADEGAATVPAVQSDAGSSAETERGRGLRIVEALSDRWGSVSGENHTVTWFELTDAAR